MCEENGNGNGNGNGVTSEKNHVYLSEKKIDASNDIVIYEKIIELHGDESAEELLKIAKREMV